MMNLAGTQEEVMEPMMSDPESLLWVYQTALHLMSWVFGSAAFASLCVYALLVCRECYSCSHLKVKMFPRVAPVPREATS